MALKGNKSDLHRGKIEIGFSSFMIIQKWKGDVKKFSEFCWQWRIGGWEVLRRGWGWRNARPQEMKRGREGWPLPRGILVCQNITNPLPIIDTNPKNWMCEFSKTEKENDFEKGWKEGKNFPASRIALIWNRMGWGPALRGRRGGRKKLN